MKLIVSNDKHQLILYQQNYINVKYSKFGVCFNNISRWPNIIHCVFKTNSFKQYVCELLRHESSQDNDWIFKYFNPGADWNNRFKLLQEVHESTVRFVSNLAA